jgi:hypothetical protein
MKLASKNLIEFIKTHISHHLSDIPKIHLSSESKELLMQLFHNIIEAEESFKTNFENGSIVEKWLDFENTAVPKGFDFNYSPEIAKVAIEKMAKFGCIFTFKINSRNIQIAIVFPTGTKNNSHYCHEKLKRMYVWLYVAMKHASAKCSQNLNVYLYLTDLKKHLPTSEMVIQQENANTGFTTTCNTTSEIHIYREEEWFKVLIHETFHNLGLDFSGIDNTKINQCIFAIFPVQTQECFFESYCEMWAEIMNILFISYFTTSSKKIENMLHKAVRMLEIEQEYSMLQCAKVLLFFGITYQDLYETTDHSKEVRANKYKEKTPIFSYYILKCMMMFFLDDYLVWCGKHNKMSIQFHKNNNNMLAYCGFVREHYNNERFLKSINIMSAWMKKHSHKHGSDIMRSLRMTCHEM